MLRRPAALLAPLLLVGLLSGCASLSQPTEDDRAAWETWYRAGMDAGDGSAVGGRFANTAAGEASDASGSAADRAQVDLDSARTFRSVELRCIGSDRASFTLTYTGSAGSTSTTQELVCHDGAALTPIAVPTALQSLTSFAATATSPDGEGFWTATLQP